MQAEQHPAFPEEQATLEKTKTLFKQDLRAAKTRTQTLKEQVAELERTSRGRYNSDLYNKKLLLSGVRARLTALPRALKKPYFARLDFQENSAGRPETVYIGKLGLRHGKREAVVDWRSPIASIYYSGQLGPVSFQITPTVGELQTVDGELLLKRQFIIEEGRLEQIFDRETATQDDLLQAILEAGADQRLKEVIATIQEEQNAIIRAPKDQVLVVQGVAGSGKTTVALHRLAYLIYTYQATLAPAKILIVGPSQLFLNYISEVLPELGVEEVRQSTFAQLARELLGLDIDIADSNDLLRLILASEPPVARRLQLARLKGSMTMREIIDRYVDELEQQILPPVDLTLETGDPALGTIPIVPRDELKAFLVNDSAYLPLMARQKPLRKFCKKRLQKKAGGIIEKLQTLCDKRIETIKRSMPDTEERRWLIRKFYDERDQSVSRVEMGVETALERYFQAWPGWDLLSLHHELFRDGARLSRLSGGAISIAQGVEFAKITGERAINTGRPAVVYEDLPPLIYLQQRVFGLKKPFTAQHIVVDEAQDLSVFQFFVLKTLAAYASFTIVGDLAQGIHSYRSIREWDEVTQKVFPGAPRSLLNLTKSYRSATEIMELGNAISSQLPASGIAPAQPVLRHCPRPRLIRGDSAEELWGTIPKLIEELEKEDCRSIAVIGKTMDECEALYTLLRPSDPITRPIQLITEKVTDRKESLVIIPGYLAKGLEFDAVIIANAAAGVYGSQEWDVKLLYVACTRAMHRLIILCAGAETPILARIDGSILARSTF
ncbi:MAG: AAA family ATPase [Firmicutes bacterium]|nr:AAA family ATPase [Bacillota bacterium]